MVIAASAAGKLTPPFFIVEGKKVMTNWLQPLERSHFSGANAALLNQLCSEGWFPGDGAIFCSSNGSMEASLMPRFIEHLDRTVRKFLPRETHFLLTLDNHGSRKGLDWIEKWKKVRCEAVLAPANTSHFLQPCDQDINKRFNREVRAVRDELAGHGTIDSKSIRFKLMCAVVAHEHITTEDCVRAFCVTGLMPFNRHFAKEFTTPLVEIVDSDEKDSTTTLTREEETVTAARNILGGVTDASRALQKLTILLQNNPTTDSIVMNLRPSEQNGSTAATQRESVKNIALISGIGAEYVTIQEAIDRRREAIAEKERAEAMKEELRVRKAAEKLATEAKKKEERAKKEEAKRIRKAEKLRVLEEKRRAVARKRDQESLLGNYGFIDDSGNGAVVETSAGESRSPTKSPFKKMLKRHA